MQLQVWTANHRPAERTGPADATPPAQAPAAELAAAALETPENRFEAVLRAIGGLEPQDEHDGWQPVRARDLRTGERSP